MVIDKIYIVFWYIFDSHEGNGYLQKLTFLNESIKIYRKKENHKIIILVSYFIFSDFMMDHRSSLNWFHLLVLILKVL